jgi:hypothetical protein
MRVPLGDGCNKVEVACIECGGCIHDTTKDRARWVIQFRSQLNVDVQEVGDNGCWEDF